MSPSRTITCAGALAALLVASAAVASSWQWRDASGRMVYSDRPPPADVRESQIVRAPAMQASARAEASAASSPAADPSQASSAPAARAPARPRSWAEREADFRKRMLERKEVEKKARDERELADAANRSCEDLRMTLRTLESGLRVVTVDARGAANPIDDAERARRVANARRDLASHCPTS